MATDILGPYLAQADVFSESSVPITKEYSDANDRINRSNSDDPSSYMA